MKRTWAFGERLTRIRRQQGFVRPHSFYMSRDGRANLGLTFRSYLNLEQGKSLPKATTLRAILRALGVGESSVEARELVQAYFASLGLGEFSALLSSAVPAADIDDVEYAARHELRRRTSQLTLDQWRALADDYGANACHCFLINTPGGAALDELARRTGLAPVEVRRAIGKLVIAKLARATRTRARSAFEGTALLEAPPLPDMKDRIAALKRHRALLNARAREVRSAVILARLTPENLARVIARLERLREFVAMCESSQRDGSEVYEIQSRILDAFPG